MARMIIEFDDKPTKTPPEGEWYISTSYSKKLNIPLPEMQVSNLMERVFKGDGVNYAGHIIRSVKVITEDET